MDVRDSALKSQPTSCVAMLVLITHQFQTIQAVCWVSRHKCKTQNKARLVALDKLFRKKKTFFFFFFFTENIVEARLKLRQRVETHKEAAKCD